MSLTLKLSSLVIRTLSKPIANQIKAQAREHERFRKLCVSMAQGLHRLDMRLRLGLLRDTGTSQKQSAVDAVVRKHKPTAPTVKTEAQTKAEEAALAKAKAAAEEAATKPAPKPHIRPLSESKAIDSGANFISETFLFMVAGGLIVFESWRSRRKETTRREDVEGRLVELEQSEKTARKALVLLERELVQYKIKHGDLPRTTHHILPREIWEVEAEEEEEENEAGGWLSRLSSYIPLFGKGEPTTAESTVDSVTRTASPSQALPPRPPPQAPPVAKETSPSKD